MTRKDYIAIAAAIRAEVDASASKYGSTSQQRIAEAIADVMERDNPRFDRARFLAACGTAQEPRREYQPKTGAACHCKPGAQRDNCRDCEGTGSRIDFAAIRASH